MTTGDHRGSALEAVTETLGLRPATAGDQRGRLGVVKGRGGPRFLIPLDNPAVGRAACLAYLGLRDGRTRIQRRTLAYALALGGQRLAVDDHLVIDRSEGSLFDHLTRALGRDDLAVAVGLGRADSVWKPTLQVFGSQGEPVAYVKVGRGPVASWLVITETKVLELWAHADDPRLVVAEPIPVDAWRGQPLAVVTPLPIDSRRLPAPVSAWPVRTLDPPIPAGPLDSSTWWTERVTTWGDEPEVTRVLERVAERLGDSELEWARAHGDWVPWNLARCSVGLVAWDWEYSEPAAPAGLDEVHCAFQIARVAQGKPVDQALAVARAAAPSSAVADLHVAMLVTRWAQVARLAGRPAEDHREVMVGAMGALA